MLFKLSNLNSNLALTLGYLNPALNNSAFNINVHVFDLYTLFTRKRLWPRPHELADILENRYFYHRHSLLTHVNGVFVHRKRRFLKTVSSRSVLLKASLSFK